MMTGNTQPKRNFLLLSGVLLLLILITPRPAYAQVGDYLLKVLFNFVVSVFGTIAGWAGLLLDFAIRELVIGFGNLYITSGLGNTVDAMWVIVRDIFNLTFIFGLVFIGLKMIFGSDNSGQKMLVSLIMAALLVNFSLFITKFVVDFSNIATVQLANTFKDASGNLSISGSFVNAIGLTSLYQVDATGNVANFFSSGSSAGGFTYIFSTMIILLIAAFVFAAGAFLLFIRFALLIFYLILSPLMFLGWVFPGGGGITSQFWSGFLGRAFFAPVYILMLYLSYRIILGFKAYPIFQTANFGKLAGSTSSSDVFAVLPPFILTAVFLIASIVIAQKMGISGAGGVISMGKSMAGKAKKVALQSVGGATFGAAAAVSRNTIGRGAQRFANSDKLNRWAAKSATGKALMQTTRAIGDSSMDLRKTAGLGATLGIGTGRKGGYKTVVDERIKADKEFAKSLKLTDVKNEQGEYVNEEIKEAVTKKTDTLKSDSADYKKVSALLEEHRNALNLALAAEAEKRDAIIAEQQRRQAEIAAAEARAAADQFNIAAKEEVETKKKELAQYNKTADEELKALSQATATAEAKVNSANKAQKAVLETLTKQAESSIKYQNQLAFIARRQREAALLNKPITSMASAIGGAGAGGVAAGGIIGGALSTALGVSGGALAGYSIASASADIKSQSADALLKEYGKYGDKMDAKKAQRKKLEEFKDFLKEEKVIEEEKKGDKDGNDK